MQVPTPHRNFGADGGLSKIGGGLQLPKLPGSAIPGNDTLQQ